MFKGKGKNKGCKGKGKGKGGKLSRQERAESRIDPEDQGNMPNHLLPLSRNLASVLRYPQNYGLDNGVDDDGWVDLVKVLPLPLFGRASAADIKTVVKESFSTNKARFETVRRGEQLLIRAAHKRPTDPAAQPAFMVENRVDEARDEEVAANVEPQCFDLSLADSGGEEQGPDFPQIMSSLRAEWSRHALGEDLGYIHLVLLAT